MAPLALALDFDGLPDLAPVATDLRVGAGSASGVGVASRPSAARARHGARPASGRREAFTLERRIADAALPVVDQVAVGACGVWVVAREHVHCARVSVRSRLGGRASLRLGGRDRTALIDALDGQVTAVRGLLYDFPEVPVQAALCLPGAEFPLLRSLSIRGHLIARPSQLRDQLERSGPLRRSRARQVAEALDARLG